MIEKVTERPEIWRIRVELPENPLRYLNSYVLPDREQPLIVDTGFHRAECWKDLSAGLEELGVRPERASLFLTHLHADHCGLAGELADRGCRVYMSGTDRDYMEGTVTNKNWPQVEARFRSEGFPPEEILNQRRANQARLYAPKLPLFPVRRVEDGERLVFAGETFLAVNTPGHTKGHMCLYLEKYQIMFTGDHVLFDITPNITPWLNMTDALGEYLKSLDKIKTFPVRLALPGHREFDGTLDRRVEQIKAHHAARLGHVRGFLEEEPGLTAVQLAQRLPWSMRGRSWADFPPTAKWFAIGETLSHLDHLRLSGQVERREVAGLWHYELTEKERT